MKEHWLDIWEKEEIDKYEEYIERCAILEFDGSMDRKDAEMKAMEIMIEKYRLKTD